MVMLHMFLALRRKMNISLRVIHINHGVRGQAGNLDEQLVRDECQRLKLPFSCKKLQGLDMQSSEEKMRQARYAAFGEYLEAFPGSKIATAHHLDDQLETFLMRLAKGSGQKGLLGIPPQRPGYIRPLLFLRRSELEQYAAKHQIVYRTDATNQDIMKTRNNIRHTIVPLLQQVFGDAFYDGFRKSVDDLQAVYGAYRQLIENKFDSVFLRESGSILCPVDFYNGLQPKLKRDLLDYCFLTLNPLTSTLPRGVFDEFSVFARQAQTGSFFFYGQLKVIKNRESLLFTNRDAVPEKNRELYPGQTVRFGGNIISLARVEYRQIRFTENENIEYICADELRFPLTVRSWRKGDFFYPIGLGKKKKVSDFFIDCKIDRQRKQTIPLICNGADIVWLAGLRLDERFKIQRNCKACYLLKTQKVSE